MKHIVLLFIAFLIFFRIEGQINSRTEVDGFKWQVYYEHGFKGAKSEKGKVLVPARYTDCSYESGHFSVQTTSGLKGIYSQDGKVIIPANKYQNILFDYFSLPVFIVVGPNGWGLKTIKGKEMLPEIFDHISIQGNSSDGWYFRLNQNGYQGIADEKGNVIISPDRHYNLVFREGDKNLGFSFSYILYNDGQDYMSGVCDSKGKEIIRTKYYKTVLKTDRSGNNYYEVTAGNSTGDLSIDGDVVRTPKPFDQEILQYGRNGTKWYLTCNKKNKFGAKDSNKKELIPCKYNMISLTKDDKYFVVEEGVYKGLYSLDGKCILPTKNRYLSVYSSGDNIFFMTEDHKSGIANDQGEILVLPKYKYADFLKASKYKGKDGVIVWCKDEGKCGAETINGQLILPCKYDNIGLLSLPDDFYVRAYVGNQVGLFSKNGQNIIPISYESIEVFSYGANGEKKFFYVKNGGKVGVFSETGRQIINAETFRNISYNIDENTFIAVDGKRICTFDEDGVLLSDNTPNIKRDEFITQADAAFEKGNYKSAASFYGKALAIKPSATLYFNRGVSNYNRDNYIEAIEDFERCLNNDPSFDLIERSLDLIGKSRTYQAAKEERREQMAGAIFGLVLSTANLYFQSKQQTNRGSGYKGYQYDDDSYDYDSSSESGYSSSTSSSSQKKSSGAVCRICHGDGKCLSCHGDGIRTDNQFGTGQDPTKKCGVCGGTGICNICHGSGRKN